MAFTFSKAFAPHNNSHKKEYLHKSQTIPPTLAFKLIVQVPNDTMTASAATRYPFSSAHNRKRRSAIVTLQEKTTKPKPVLSFVASIDVASSSAEMPANEMKLEQTSSPLSTSSSFDEEQLESVFREQTPLWAVAESRDESPSDDVVYQDDNEMWTLKRASPIADDDSNEEFIAYESPTKKAKTQTIFWENHVSDSGPFDLGSFLEAR